MLSIRILWALVALVLQALLLLAVARLARRPARAAAPQWPRVSALLVVLAAQALAAGAFAAGGRAEKYHGVFSTLEAVATPAIPYEPFVPTGDAALVQRVSTVPEGSSGRPTSLAELDRLRQRVRDSLFALADEAAVVGLERRGAVQTLDGGIRRTLVSYRASDGSDLPAYLFEPAADGRASRRAAVLVIPGHGEGIVETARLAASYQHGSALALARAGYVTLTPELRGFGYLGDRVGTGHEAVAYNALQAGTFYKAVVLRDLERALGALRALPTVDSARVGVTGWSLGGDLAVSLAALDVRVRAVVVQGFLGQMGPAVGSVPGRVGTDRQFDDHYCAIVPRFNQFLRNEDMFALVAPRPMLVVGGAREIGRRRETDLPVLAATRDVYHALGVSERFEWSLQPGSHEWFEDPAVRFFARFL